MNNEMFKEHHPHRLSDYISRSSIELSRKFVSTLGKNYAIRSVISNTILSSFAMILANSIHQKNVLKGLGDRDAIEDLLCEASAIHFQIIVARDLVELRKSTIIWLYILRAVAVCKFRLISFLSTSAAHRILGYIYEKSVADYSNWIDAIKTNEVVDIEASKIAIAYYELSSNAMLSDVLSAMRSDCIKYRDEEHHRAG